MQLSGRRALRLVAAALAAAVVLPAGAAAARAQEDDEVRVEGVCSRASEVSLRARADDGSIRVELRIDTRRQSAPWSVILLHERRIAYRRVVRTSRSSGSIRLRREVKDLYGRDTFVVRASGPGRETCRVTATL